MIDSISLWVKNIALLVLFSSFLELLLPSTSMQRFIRVIIGLFIMLAILNPVIDIIQTPWRDVQVPAISTNLAKSDAIINNSKQIAKDREQISQEVYKKELSKQLRATVIAIEGVADAQVVIETNNSQEDLLSLANKKFSIYIKPGIGTGYGKVSKVSIGNAVQEQADLDSRLKDKIIKTISELYQIPKEKIEVKQLNH